jgi:hypothetical protein
MKSRINWSVIPDLSRRAELKKLAAKMKRKGYTRIYLNYHGEMRADPARAGTFSISGYNPVGGVWIS